ncbi:MAG: hypothetical protein K2O56_03345, partial [Muribaculaceae bacterium]|nr:hypothetical protein [Muribaculaceae bacterium]
IDEPWEVIDLPVVVGKPEQGETLSEQAIANAALNVNKFARTPVKLPENTNFMTAFMSDEMSFCGDYIEPFEMGKDDEYFEYYLTGTADTKINGEYYRKPTGAELLDLFPAFNMADYIGSISQWNVDAYELDESNSISGQKTLCYFISPDMSGITDARVPMFILSGLIDKTDTGGSKIDNSDAQAKIHKLRWDADEHIFIMDVMALKTVDLEQMFRVDPEGYPTYLNMEAFYGMFETEDKLTFRFGSSIYSNEEGNSIYFRTVSQIDFTNGKFYEVGFEFSASPTINGDMIVEDDLKYDKYSMMLIKGRAFEP